MCADPAAYPTSSQGLDGYENRIAQILADELGANLTFEWTLISDATVRSRLKGGDCDLVMSAGEGAMGLLNTVAYQRIPNVFLYLTDSGFSAESLYDSYLSTLRIATVPNSSMNAVLFDLGLAPNYVGIQPDGSKRGYERIQPTVDALLAGEVDVAIVSGASASEYVRDRPGTFDMTPVQPELVPPLTPTFFMATIGVRPRDEGLRDALNTALARRWDEVQQVFIELGVPTVYSPAILATDRPADEVRLGVIAPFPTGFAATMDSLAESAYFGARLADDLALRSPSRADTRLRLIFASAPSTTSALRAFDRLVAYDGVDAVVVIHDSETTKALAQRSVTSGVPMLNALNGEQTIRTAACYPTVFHVAPSDDQYTLGLVQQLLLSGDRSVAIVTDTSARMLGLGEVAKSALDSVGVSSMHVAVSSGLAFPYAEVAAVTETSVDSVLLFLPPDAQVMYTGELIREGFAGRMLGFPWPEMQTRESYLRLAQDINQVLITPRVSGWDASLSEDGASELNLRFASRSAQVMDVTAWATYAAVDLAVQAAIDSRHGEGTVADALTRSPERTTLHKGSDISFQASTQQLLQPLYLVQASKEGRWSAAVSERIGFASVVATLLPIMLDLQEPQSIGCD